MTEMPAETATEGFWGGPLRPVKVASSKDDPENPSLAAAATKAVPSGGGGQQLVMVEKKSKEDAEDGDKNTQKASRRRRGKGKEVDPSLLGFTAPPLPSATRRSQGGGD